MKKAIILVMLIAVLLSGCVGADQNTATRTLSGGAVGAGAGALIGWAAVVLPAAPPSAVAPAWWEDILTINTRSPRAGRSRAL